MPTLDFGHGKIEFLHDDNLVYCKLYGIYTDDDSIAMRSYLDTSFAKTSGPTIRIWDTSNILPGQYRLTPKGVDRTTSWGGIREKEVAGKHYVRHC